MDPESVDRIERVPHGGSDDPSVLDFSANTNPRTPDGVAEVYDAALERAQRYPDEPRAFRRAAAAAVDCDPAAVIPTAGGLAAIRLAIATTVAAGDSVLLPVPSFGEYAREVRLQGGEPVYRPHDDLFGADPEPHAMAVVCHPNNPTGTAYDDAALRSFVGRCRDAGTVVLVDEAFLGFTDRLSLAGTDGVVVARSLTKLFGLPGLRAGYAVATGELGERLAVAETRRRVQRERERVAAALDQRERIDVAPSEAPYLLLKLENPDGLLATAESAGLALRDARTFRGLDSHVRVAIRLPEENDRLLGVLAGG
ncbi:threonine-phosphate decarboxylase [Halobacteriales archaeon QH_10_67_13]|nr:MAG: threonine-phosphate decarboxylase [Halobacteriales archaeon QH_10_67_13]